MKFIYLNNKLQLGIILLLFYMLYKTFRFCLLNLKKLIYFLISIPVKKKKNSNITVTLVTN